MKNQLKYLIFSLLLIQLLASCGVAYRVLLGVDSRPNWNTNKQINRQAKRYKIPEGYNLVLDTAAYYKGLKEIYALKKKGLTITEKDSSAFFALKGVWKDDTQPTQFRLFDKDGIETFKIVNCYVDPPIPMNWNVEGCFNAFPPKIDIESLNTHNYDLNFLLKNSSTMDKRKISFADLPKSNYYGVILWNDFFQRPSRKLIKTVRKYIAHSGQSVQLVFINNQNAYLWQEMDSKNREKVKTYLQKKP